MASASVNQFQDPLHLVKRAAAIEPSLLDSFCDDLTRIPIDLGDMNNFGLLLALGLAHWRAKRYILSIQSLDKILPINRHDSDYLILRGMVLKQFPDRKQEALECFHKGVVLQPDRADSYYNLANLLVDLEKPPEAERSFRLSIELNSSAPLALHNLGICLNEQQRFSEGLAFITKSLEIDPGSADAWCNLGLSYFGLELFDKAKDAFSKAISLDASHGASHVNMGNALVNTLEPESALLFLEKGVELESSSANSLWNLSLAYLLTGDFKNGWEYYEARFSTNNFQDYQRPCNGEQPRKLADCSHDPGQPLVVWTEQGVGDAIQFSRYLLMLDAAGVSFIFMTRPSLINLFKDWLPSIKDKIFDQPSKTNLSDKRQQIPLLSLPRLFKTELHSIPATTPYLECSKPIPPELFISPPPGGLSIGLVWASNPTNKSMYRNKSASLKVLMPLFLDLMQLDLIDLHSLQVGKDAEQIKQWLPHPRITDWSTKLQDFSDTASVVKQLDLIISVDTAVAHLAGALHRNTWLLLPHNADFRWLRDRDDSPWYSTFRIFRQPDHHDWDGLVLSLRSALNQLFMFDLKALAEKA